MKKFKTCFAFFAFLACFAGLWAVEAPTGLTSTRQSALSIALKWTAPSGAEPAGYELQRAPDQNGLPGQPVFLKAVADAFTAVMYVDNDVNSDMTYHYRVRSYQAGFDGSESSTLKSAWTDFYKVKTLASAGAPKITGAVVAPGKASGSLIEYEVLTSGPVDLRIYTVDGVLVRTLVNEVKTGPQKYSEAWGTTNEQGVKVASGTYLVHLKSPDQNVIRKIVVVR